MNITTIPFAVLRFQYQVARFPLQLIEDRVVGRLGAEAPARLAYERTLGALDATVGRALGDPRLRNRGTKLAERSDTLTRAAQLDAAAARKREHADTELDTRREGAIEDRKQAREERQQDVEAARTEAQDKKRAAVQAADARAAEAKRQAD